MLGVVGSVTLLAAVTYALARPADERSPTTPAVLPPAAASGPTSLATTTTSTIVVAPPPAVAWHPCNGTHQCASLDVPLDYAAPSGPHIAIALERRPAGTTRRIGSLVINPGGPGESGILNLSKDLALLPPGVLARFDVIAFDPRGVGQSSPVHCEGGSRGGPSPDPVPTTPAGEDALLAVDRAYAAACLHGSGQILLDHVGTVDVARDLESLRRAVGDPGLTYLGLSYGTLLGATYAGLFPRNVRAMVLDGALDPSLTMADLAGAQAKGFQDALDAFFGWCAGNGACAWRPGPDPHGAFEALVAAVRRRPLAVGARQVGPQEFYTGTFATLYARSFWPSLGRALAAVTAGDGSSMLGLYDGYERTGDPSFSGDANNAVTCLDHPVPRDPSLYFQRAAEARRLAPDFGPLFAWGALTCAVWPAHDAQARPVASISAPGSPPIVVVGTTRDPATPYAWAQALARQLAHGVLLTRVGEDHVAIFSSSCVRAFDETYLVTGVAPATGTVCPS